MSFVAITFCVASEQVFIVVYFVTDSVRKLLDTHSYILKYTVPHTSVLTECCVSFLHSSALRSRPYKNYMLSYCLDSVTCLQTERQHSTPSLHKTFRRLTQLNKTFELFVVTGNVYFPINFPQVWSEPTCLCDLP
jgi:hypothetical protein